MYAAHSDHRFPLKGGAYLLAMAAMAYAVALRPLLALALTVGLALAAAGSIAMSRPRGRVLRRAGLSLRHLADSPSRIWAAAIVVLPLLSWSHYEVLGIGAPVAPIAVLGVITLASYRRDGTIPTLGGLREFTFVAFAVLVLASSVLLGGPDAMRLAVGSVLAAVIAFLVLRSVFARDQGAFDVLWIAFAVLTIVLGAMGVFEFVTSHDLLTFSGGSLPTSGVEGVRRANGPFPSDVEYGLALLMCLAFVLAGWRGARREPRHRAVLGATALALSVPAVYATYFRTTWIVAIALIAFWAWRRGPATRAAMSVCVAAAVVVFAWAAPSLSTSQIVKTRVLSSENVTGRLATYSKALRIFADHPVAGVGFANFGSDQRYIAEDGVASLNTPHSAYLGALSELGIAGFALLIGTFFIALRTVIRLGRGGDAPATAREFAHGALWAGVLFVVFAADFQTLSLPFPLLLFFSSAGIAAGAARARPA